MYTTTPFEVEGNTARRREPWSTRVPGFQNVTIWSADGQHLEGYTPDHVAERVPRRPTPDRLAKARREVLHAGGMSLGPAVGLMLGVVGAVMLLPRLNLNFHSLMVVMIGSVLLGGILGAVAEEIRYRRVAATWKAYDRALAASGVGRNFMSSDETVITTARETLMQAARAQDLVVDWPDLARGVPDVRTLASSAYHARITARQATGELEALKGILVGTDKERDDQDVAAVRAHCVEVTTAAQLANGREAAAVDALREAGEVIAQVIASARSRDYIRGAAV